MFQVDVSVRTATCDEKPAAHVPTSAGVRGAWCGCESTIRTLVKLRCV